MSTTISARVIGSIFTRRNEAVREFVKKVGALEIVGLVAPETMFTETNSLTLDFTEQLEVLAREERAVRDALVGAIPRGTLSLWVRQELFPALFKTGECIVKATPNTHIFGDYDEIVFVAKTLSEAWQGVVDVSVSMDGELARVHFTITI